MTIRPAHKSTISLYGDRLSDETALKSIPLATLLHVNVS